MEKENQVVENHVDCVVCSSSVVVENGVVEEVS